jgi:4a-hydroxytetrahydrobiopterin dehydratase
MATLTEAELRAALNDLEGWEGVGSALRKEFVFNGFREAIAFVNRVAERAEAANHHPDIEIHYHRVGISLSTHDEGGITSKDVALAGELEAAASEEA